ncbi:hypothetical protein [Pedobacter sp. JY14-1]|uniref:hypothetical protein n=1 Tax=Pedobacter sp. JY14-1 TaxID=3034151 RepID=UPI0023E09486|nr:hypothetical protein [Pedobacter sp. JY14-1]
MSIRCAVLLIIAFLFQDNSPYTVMNNDSSAYSRQLGRPLQAGDRIMPSDSISFTLATGTLKLAGHKGSYYVSARKGKAVMLDHVLTETGQIPIRAGRGAGINSTSMLMGYLSGIVATGKPLLIVDSLQLEVSAALYNRRTDIHYVIEYIKEDRTVTGQLKWLKKGGTCFLQIDGRVLGKATAGKPVPVSVFEKDATGRKQRIASLSVAFYPSSKIAPELNFLRTTMQQNEIVESEILHDAAYSYLAAHYGIPDTGDFFEHILPLSY